MTEPARAGDPRFFGRTGPHGLGAVAQAAGGTLADGANVALSITGVSPLQLAGPTEVSFLDNRRYAALLEQTKAGAVLVHPAMAHRVPAGCIAIVMKEPRIGWAKVAAFFHPLPPARPGVHPTAVVDPSAKVDPSAEIGPLAVIEAGAVIGPRCRLGPGAVVGEGVVMGADCRIANHASVSHAVLGDRVSLHPGARVGQEGFGFEPTATGFLTVPQLGRVILGDDVEIGANTTVDRGAGPDTMIGAGSRLDNLVQIGHNVQLGRCCVIASQAGISGSTVLEDFVQLGGQAGLTGHLHIGRKARIGAQAGVMSNIEPDADVLGSPAQPLKEFLRHVAFLRRFIRQSETERTGGATPPDGKDAG